MWTASVPERASGVSDDVALGTLYARLDGTRKAVLATVQTPAIVPFTWGFDGPG